MECYLRPVCYVLTGTFPKEPLHQAKMARWNKRDEKKELQRLQRYYRCYHRYYQPPSPTSQHCSSTAPPVQPASLSWYYRPSQWPPVLQTTLPGCYRWRGGNLSESGQTRTNHRRYYQLAMTDTTNQAKAQPVLPSGIPGHYRSKDGNLSVSRTRCTKRSPVLLPGLDRYYRRLAIDASTSASDRSDAYEPTDPVLLTR